MGFHDGGWWTFVRYDEKRDRPRVSGRSLRRVAGYARPYWPGILLMLVSIIAITLLNLVPPLLMRDLIDHALPERDYTRLNWLALGMILAPLTMGLLGVLQRFLGSRIGEGIIYDLRRSLFDHIQRQSLRFFTNTRTGELMSRLNNDVVGSQRAVTGTVVQILSNVIALVSTLIIMLSLEWRLTLLGVAILPLFIIPARRVGRILRGLTREGMSLNAEMNALMNETLNVSGALLAKLFGRGPDESRRFGDRARRVRDIGVRQALVGQWFMLGLSLVSAAGTALVFWLGGHLVLSGAFTIGTLVAFGAYLVQLYGPLSALTNARVEFATSMVSFERVFEVLDLPVEIADQPDARPLGDVRGEVRFDQVSFSYQVDPNEGEAGLEDVARWGGGGDVPSPKPAARNGHGENGASLVVGAEVAPRWALRAVDFTIAPGQLVALVGPSGAGKSTLISLLPRLYDPTEGRVLIDGQDLRAVTLTSLAAQVGMVTQESYLFHDTIRRNLLYARPDASQEQLAAAARAANIYDFIANLPDGFDTVVGERGYRLSGGEKQRIAIARVVLKDPRILVLDEATSHLDSQSESLIQAALEPLMRGRTSLVIAHRLSTILAADLILVLDRGRIVERGTHAELLAAGGLYAALYETQFRPELTAANP